MVLVMTVLSGTAVAGASPQPDESAPAISGWSATILPQSGESGALAVAVAAGPVGFVAVGERVCEAARRDVYRCWGQVWTSPDGVDWDAADAHASGLELGYLRPATSGPEIGLQGIAYGPDGFMAFGRAQPTANGRQMSALWRSDDGTTWQRIPTKGGFPASTRLRTIIGADDGYLLGGVVYREQAPRAAIWSSPDGQAWTRARGKETFAIGGYIDTLEDPGSGGVNAFALYPGVSGGHGSLSDGVVAAGQRCVPSDDREPWVWAGACWGDLWRSADGLTWQQAKMPRPQGAITLVIAAGGRMVLGAPICHDDCASALMLTADGSDWQVAYGSPVGGELKAMTAANSHFQALLAVPDAGTSGHGQTLAMWSSGDGLNWALEESQPTLPVDAIWIHHVDMAVAGDRLVVTVSGEGAPDGDVVSIALLSPSLP